MYDMGWGEVLTYCGIEWENYPDTDFAGQIKLEEY